MAIAKSRPNRRESGKKYKAYRKKKLSELGRNSALTLLGERRVKLKRARGNSKKFSLLADKEVSVADSQGKTKKLQITSIKENPANINYARRNIITKGAIVTTSEGNVKITSRPGQTGILQGKFVE